VNFDVRMKVLLDHRWLIMVKVAGKYGESENDDDDIEGGSVDLE
jgi:hypothetical protein